MAGARPNYVFPARAAEISENLNQKPPLDDFPTSELSRRRASSLISAKLFLRRSVGLESGIKKQGNAS